MSRKGLFNPAKLADFLAAETSKGNIFYPPHDQILFALEATPLESVKVVILGQDPYHGEGQAHGLAFSVPEGISIPPSLINIFKEIEREYSKPLARKGNLTGWAQQGVLLLNTTLTVRASQPGSHQKKGWEELTDAIIRVVSEKSENTVFMLWGSHAQKKAELVDNCKHLILKAPHPSPLSAHRGFIGCGHFKDANTYLAHHKKAPIDWYDL